MENLDIEITMLLLGENLTESLTGVPYAQLQDHVIKTNFETHPFMQLVRYKLLQKIEAEGIRKIAENLQVSDKFLEVFKKHAPRVKVQRAEQATNKRQRHPFEMFAQYEAVEGTDFETLEENTKFLDCFVEKVVSDHSKTLSYSTTARKFNLSTSLIKKWVQIYRGGRPFQDEYISNSQFKGTKFKKSSTINLSS